MSAPGVQLYSPAPLNYFEPDVRTYIQKIEQAAVSNNLPAARQAFEQLDKFMRDPTSIKGKAAKSPSAEVEKSLADVGQALQEGDLNTAAAKLAGLRASFSTPSGGTASPESQSASQTSEGEGTPTSNQTVSVRI